MTIYNTRRASIASGQTISPRIGLSCFESVKIKANLSLDSAPMTTYHPSQVAAFMAFGNFIDGHHVAPMVGMRCELKPGDIMKQKTIIPPASMKFTGERYQLEFFLPDLENS
ncbi:hypothetical protein BDZ45DRAFT_753022 [Acephala macrosclerotiorum]|nr:hypothetical protein BDZ45DRAFT_753022 [Acephala macrosclerotiorum]